MNSLSQLTPETWKMLLMHLQSQQQEPTTPNGPQFDPNMLMALLRGERPEPARTNMLAGLFKASVPRPPSTSGIGVRG